MHIDKALSLLRNVNFTNDLSKGLQEFPSESCLHDTLFSYIKELEEMKLHDTHVSIRKKNKNYWCTTYNQSYEAKKFIKQIERNKFNIIELLFEADVLISKNSPLPQIEFGKGKIIDITSEELQELSKHTGTNYSDFPTRIIEPKNIEILDFEAAKGELKC